MNNSFSEQTDTGSVTQRQSAARCAGDRVQQLCAGECTALKCDIFYRRSATPVRFSNNTDCTFHFVDLCRYRPDPSQSPSAVRDAGDARQGGRSIRQRARSRSLCRSPPRDTTPRRENSRSKQSMPRPRDKQTSDGFRKNGNICKFWRFGYCKNGSRCRFDHVMSNRTKLHRPRGRRGGRNKSTREKPKSLGTEAASLALQSLIKGGDAKNVRKLVSALNN